MELRQLKHFLEVVRRSSFGEAATAVGLTQPAISKSIKSLEEELQVILVQRTPSGVFSTPYGKLLYEFAESIDNQVRRVTDEIDALRGSKRGIVRIGAGPSVIRNLLPDIVAGFGRRLPNVDVMLFEGAKEELFQLLRRGSIDLMLSTLREQDKLAEFQHRIVLEDAIDIVASAGHPLAGRATVTLEDLAPYCWLMPGIGEPERQQLHAMFAAAGLPMPKAKVQTMSLGFLGAYLPRTDCLSYASRRLSGLTAQSDVVALRIDLDDWRRPIGVTTLRDTVTMPAVRVFVEEIEKAGKGWLDGPQ